MRDAEFFRGFSLSVQPLPTLSVQPLLPIPSPTLLPLPCPTSSRPSSSSRFLTSWRPSSSYPTLSNVLPALLVQPFFASPSPAYPVRRPPGPPRVTTKPTLSDVLPALFVQPLSERELVQVHRRPCEVRPVHVTRLNHLVLHLHQKLLLRPEDRARSADPIPPDVRASGESGGTQ